MPLFDSDEADALLASEATDRGDSSADVGLTLVVVDFGVADLSVATALGAETSRCCSARRRLVACSCASALPFGPRRGAHLVRWDDEEGVSYGEHIVSTLGEAMADEMPAQVAIVSPEQLSNARHTARAGEFTVCQDVWGNPLSTHKVSRVVVGVDAHCRSP